MRAIYVLIGQARNEIINFFRENIRIPSKRIILKITDSPEPISSE